MDEDTTASVTDIRLLQTLDGYSRIYIPVDPGNSYTGLLIL
jgi:hypothetical protein